MGGPAWLISYFTYLFGGIPGFLLLFFEVVGIAFWFSILEKWTRDFPCKIFPFPRVLIKENKIQTFP
jgi:hypothetical protein